MFNSNLTNEKQLGAAAFALSDKIAEAPISECPTLKVSETVGWRDYCAAIGVTDNRLSSTALLGSLSSSELDRWNKVYAAIHEKCPNRVSMLYAENFNLKDTEWVLTWSPEEGWENPDLAQCGI